jgi:predicted metal-dependent RNase
MLQAEVEDLKR